MTVTDESLLSALREAIDPETSPVATPDDVAGWLPIGAEAVRQRLLRFAADGDVATRKVGRSRVFWVDVDDRPDYLADRGHSPDDRNIDDIITVDQCNSCGWEPAAVIYTGEGWECYNCGDDPNRPDRGAPDALEFDPDADVDELLQEATDDVDDVDEAIGAVETPADTPDRETFERAAEAVLAHLRDVGVDTRSGFISALHSDHSAGYPNERTWWRRVAKPLLEAHPDVVAPQPGGSKWSLTD